MLSLVKITDDNARLRYPLTRILQRIGRDPTCEVFVNDEAVSRVHAEITQTGEGVFIRDKGSTNGTYVNGRRVDDQCRIGVGDRVAIAGHQFVLVEEDEKSLHATIAVEPDAARVLRLPGAAFEPELPNVMETTVREVPGQFKTETDIATGAPRLVVESGSKKGAAVPLAQPEVTIGRSLECHLALPDSQVSAHHARIVQRKGGYYLYDERSLNGVFVNDAKVRGVALRSGDSIRLGETLLRFLDPAAPPMPPAEPAPGPIHPVGRYGARRWILVGGAALALLLAILYWIWR